MIKKAKSFLQKIKGKIKINGKRHEKTMHISKDIILRYLPDNPIIIDCGAHIGIDSASLSSFPGSFVYSFEPVKGLFKVLLENTRDHSNIKCYNIALSDHDGESDMYISGGDSDGSSSLLKPKDHLQVHPTVTFNEIVKVECQKLDTWAKKNNVSKVDLLWIDMQGAEQRMLMASKEIFHTVSVIHTEVSLRETYEGVDTYQKYKKFLLKNGFKVVIEAIPAGYDMGNVLFVRKDLTT
jgi:FkbM family methyltransferase